ncbi:hypothetical protein DVH24_000954 [Malus domestica]|uniref:Zer-1-like leucine-rich repeats region domain-containing protein n=1 Tax=Malus domestica TaxID=3750 RepID=A0A498JXU3_MALDO|nr:hypothetical protein DVH24_000954 [Malus domestica]
MSFKKIWEKKKSLVVRPREQKQSYWLLLWYQRSILEPMEHLKSLNLSKTTVQELHSSIQFLPTLQIIQLHDCKRPSSNPKSICKLKCLKHLDLSSCSELENFPEILEPMKDLKFV